nr:hypothetical protein [Salmonella enterica]
MEYLIHLFWLFIPQIVYSQLMLRLARVFAVSGALGVALFDAFYAPR